MRLIRQVINIFKEGFQGLWRNKGMSFTSTISIAAMLTLFGIVLLMILNINTVVYQTGEKLDKVVFYFKDSAKPEEINELIAQIQSDSHVKKVSYVSKDQALADFKKKFGDSSYIFDSLPGNPVPASITVEMKELSFGKEIENKYKDRNIVDEHSYYYDIVSKMMRVEKGVKYVGSGVVLILLFVCILIIHNTIKIAVANRRREITIMKYVGATNSYIRGPFLMEGILFGIAGAIIATFITKNLYSHLYEKMNPELYQMTRVHLIHLPLISSDLLIIFLCIGIGIGYLGSLISTKRFLDV